MKASGNLYKKITSFENLWLAARKARKGKRFKKSVSSFEENLENELLKLQEELLNKTYRPGSYNSFDIYEPKKRMISAAPYRDRVVHHAICNIIEPVYEPTFIFDSYANRKIKGTHRAILRFQQFAKNYTYVLKSDVKKFFPSMDHAILKVALKRKIKCQGTLALIFQIIDNSNPQEPVFNLFPGDDLFTDMERRKGIPIGNLTSQFFANIYLNKFDHYVKEVLKCKGYIRYVDDFVIFGNDKKALWETLELCKVFLAGLRLVLHPNKSNVFMCNNGVPFLGHRVFPDFRLLKKENIRRFKRRFRKNWKMYNEDKLSENDLIIRFNSWQGHACFSKTWQLRSTIVRFLTAQGIGSKMAFSGAARGTTTTTGTAAWPTATGTTQTTGTTTTVSVSPSTIHCQNRFFYGKAGSAG